MGLGFRGLGFRIAKPTCYSLSSYENPDNYIGVQGWGTILGTQGS